MGAQPPGKHHSVPQKTLNIKWKYRLSCFLFHSSLFSFISLLLHCFYAILFLNMFLAAAGSLTGTDVVLGVSGHCSGATARACVSTFSGCGESDFSSLNRN